MEKTCLVTGGAGFIGCATIPGLCERFDRVVVVDSLISQVHSTRSRPADLDSRAEFFLGDVTEAKTWQDAIGDSNVDTVIHLAAETGTGQSLTHSTLHASTNVIGTSRMLDYFNVQQRLPRKVILTSSRAVYGEGRWQDDRTGKWVYPGQRGLAQLQAKAWDFAGLTYRASAADEIAPNPTSVYGATKLAQEHILSAWANALGVETCILRFQNVYGEGQSLTNSYTGIVSLFCRLAREGKSIPLYEDGKMLRDFVHISDVARSVLACLTKGTGIIDIGTGLGQTVSHLADVIAKIYGAPMPHICGLSRPGDVRHATCLPQRAAQELNWSAKVSLEDGCRRLAAWIEGRI